MKTKGNGPRHLVAFHRNCIPPTTIYLCMVPSLFLMTFILSYSEIKPYTSMADSTLPTKKRKLKEDTVPSTPEVASPAAKKIKTEGT